MTSRRHAVVPVVVSAVVLLAGCGGPAEPATAEAPASSVEPAPADAIAASAEPHGIAGDLVHVTEIDGFTLATQSVGIVGDEGMSAAYTGPGGTVLLTTARAATPSVPACDELPDAPQPDEPLPDLSPAGELRCEVVRGPAHVLLTADDGVPADVLAGAGAAVRPPTVHELDVLFAHLPPPYPPVERGDLPAEGDGAPDNSVGPGG